MRQVEVFATQESIAIGRQHFELMLAIDFGNFDTRNVEGTAAQDRRPAILAVTALLIHTVGQAAAVGSLMMRFTSRPAILPASLVAWRWESSK